MAPDGDDALKLYFACVGNSARSQMAEAMARELGGDRVAAASGGTRPKGHVLPTVLEALEEAGIDWSHGESKGIDAERVEAADLVVTMGCGEDCPAFIGKKVVDWPLDDPDGMDLAGVRRVRDAIEARVRELLAARGVL